MVKLRFAVVIGAVLLLLVSCKEQPRYVDGVYYGASYGYYSVIHVAVTIENGFIATIEIVDHQEPEILADIVFTRLLPMMVKQNRADLDVIAGATYTSESVIEAVGHALEQASKEDQ